MNSAHKTVGSGQRRRQRTLFLPGFTLAEVAVGLALFSLTAVVITQSVMHALEAYRLIEVEDPKFKSLRYVRQNILSVTDRSALEEGATLTTPEGLTTEWEVEVLPADLLDLFLIRFSVEWKSDVGREPPTTGELYVYRPGWADSAERQAWTQQRMEWLSEQLETGEGIE